MAKNHPACSHCHKREQTQVLTISSPDSFQTRLRCCVSRFVCTSPNALGVSAPAFRTHAPGLVQRNPVLQTAPGKSSCGRQSLWGLNHKHHAENQGLHKATYAAVIVHWTFTLGVTRRRLVFLHESYQNQFEAKYYWLALWIVQTLHPPLKVKCVSCIGLFSGWIFDV